MGCQQAWPAEGTDRGRMAQRHLRTAIALAAVMAAGSGPASAVTGDPVEFPLVDGSTPIAIAIGPDGNVWTADGASNTISRVGPAGATAAFIIPTAGSMPTGIAAGPDGAMWFTERAASRIGRITVGGVIREFIVPTAGSMPTGIAAGPDGAMWFTERAASRIGRISMTGTITEVDLPAAMAAPTGISAGPDGMMLAAAGGIAALGMDGSVAMRSLPPGSRPQQVALVDGQVWYTSPDTDEVGRLAGGNVQTARLSAGSRPYGVAQAPGGGAWVTLPGGNAVLRLGTDLQVVGRTQLRPGQALPLGVQTGADGNGWVTLAGSGSLVRVKSGAVPVSTAPPTVVVSSVAGRPVMSDLAALAPGMTLAAGAGSWSYLPARYEFEWQRCATPEASTCRRVSDAPSPGGASVASWPAYAVSAADVGMRLRVVVRAASLAGVGEPAASAMSPPVGGEPAAASLGPLSSRVEVGGQVTADLRVPASLARGHPGRYRVAFTSGTTLGTVTFRWRSGGRQAVVANVLVTAGGAACTWTPPVNWPAGRTILTAAFQPAAGTVFAAARMRRALSIR